MEKVRQEIDSAVTELKDELQKNFNGKNYQRITETANFILNRSVEAGYLKGQYGALNILGGASFNICDYEKAQKYYLESINIAEKLKDDKKNAYGLNNIGIIFFTLQQFDKALVYYKKALELKLNYDDKSSISTSFSNIGLAYNMLKDSDKALDYFQRSLDIDRTQDNKYAICRDLNNIGLAWKDKGDPEKALEFFEESYSVSKKENSSKGMATTLTNIANLHIELNNTDLALDKALEGEKIALSINSDMHLLHFYRVLPEVYKKKNNYRKAFEYFEKFIKLKDKIFSEESNNKIFEMQIKYESEKKDRESELYRLKNEQLSVLNATKDKFFRIIHHDLLNPFTAIHTTSEFLEKHYDKIDENKRKNYIKNISAASERLLKLMDNLFAWVKTQTGQIDYKPEKVDLKEIIEHSVKLLGNNMHSKEIVTELKIPKKCFVIADKNMIDTIVRNLIANAIKFTHNKGSIAVTLKNHSGSVFFTVQDNGVGMEKDNLSKLFKVSETFSTPGTNDEKGTGLGLILVKEFLDINKGKIKVESKPGKGSRFTVELPAAK